MDKHQDDKITILRNMAKECIAVRVRLISRIITNIYDTELRPLGLKLNQLNILVVVSLKSEISYDELCKRLKIEKSTLSRNVERLKKRGLIEIISDKSDKRKLLRVSSDGEKLLLAANIAWETAQKKAKDLLGTEGTQVICSIANGIWRKEKES